MLAFGKPKKSICLIMIMDDSNHYKYILMRATFQILCQTRLPVSAGLSSVSLRPCDIDILQPPLYTFQSAFKKFKLTD